MRNFFIIFLIFQIMFFICFSICGCGSSSSSPPSPPSGPISKLYLAGKADSIMVFNAETVTTETSVVISGAANLNGAAISPDKTVLYAVDSSSLSSNKKIYSYNLETYVSDNIDISAYDKLGRYAATSLDGSRIFAPAGSNAGLFVFLTSPFSLEDLYTTSGVGGDKGRGIVCNSSYAYIANEGTSKGLILKYNIAQKTIEASVEIPENGKPWFIRFDLSGNKLYVPATNLNKVFILNLSNFLFESGSIEAGSYPTDIGFISSSKAYVTNLNDDTISVIDVPGRTQTDIINTETNSKPISLVVDHNRNKAYVNYAQASILNIIDVVTDTIVSTIEFSSATDQIAVK